MYLLAALTCKGKKSTVSFIKDIEVVPLVSLVLCALDSLFK